MNPSWTGRSARTLDECRFWNADPIERHRSDYSPAWWIAIGIVALCGVMAIVHFGNV